MTDLLTRADGRAVTDDATPEMPALKPSILDASQRFTRYAVELQFRDKALGTQPGDPKVAEGHIRATLGEAPEDQLRKLVMTRLIERHGMELVERQEWTQAQWEAIVLQIANEDKVNGFKRDRTGGLYLESRMLKAAIKETVNILFAGERWGPTAKGPRNYVAERVFVNPERIYFGRHQPDGIQTLTGTVGGPNGSRQIISRAEYVARATITAEIMVLDAGVITKEHWDAIFTHMQENGLAGGRNQGFGRFNLTRWELLSKPVGRTIPAKVRVPLVKREKDEPDAPNPETSAAR